MTSPPPPHTTPQLRPPVGLHTDAPPVNEDLSLLNERAHFYSDLDRDDFALHHTLGRPGGAAKFDHTHKNIVMGAKRATDQTVNAGTTTIVFNSIDTDKYALLDTSTGLWTCKKAGLYETWLGVEWQANVTGTFRQIFLRCNQDDAQITAMETRPPVNDAAVPTRMTLFSGAYSLNLNDVCEARVTHNAGIALKLQVAGKYSVRVRTRWVGPLP